MKKMKRFMSLMLALVLALAMGITAFADDDPPTPETSNQSGTSTSNTQVDVSNHTFMAYQIFTGTQASNDDKLASIDWGAGVNKETILNALKNDLTLKTHFENCESASDVASVISEWTETKNAIDLEAFIKVVSAPANKGKGWAVDVTTGKLQNEREIPKADGTTTKTYDLPAGYYWVEDTTDVNGKDDARNKTLLQLTKAGSITIRSKSDIPTVEKKVKETNDSTGVVTGWQDAADYDVNDKIPFQLTGTLPSDYASYSTYEYKFHDVMSAGLTLDIGSIKVYKVNDKDLDTEKHKKEDVTAQFKIDTPEKETGSLTDKCSFEVSVQDLKKVISDVEAKAGDKIVVEYNATLNSSAVIGSAGNPNTVLLEYSNKPNEEGTGKTKEDKVTVFTFKLVTNKVEPVKGEDEKKEYKPLKGAGFTLSKRIDVKGDDGSVSHNWVPIGDEIKGNDTTTFSFERIDAGVYKLEETTVPDGYNKAADIIFVVKAVYETNSIDPKLTSLVIEDENGNTLSSGDEPEFTVTVGEKYQKVKDENGKEINKDGLITTDVVNNKGITLPSTGGIGTTIFYVVGGIMVFAAVVLLVTKKRMNGKK